MINEEKNSAYNKRQIDPRKDLIEEVCKGTWGYLTNGRDTLAIGMLFDINANYYVISPFTKEEYPKDPYKPIKRVWINDRLPIPKDRSIYFVPVGKKNLENQINHVNRNYSLDKLDSIAKENHLTKNFKKSSKK